MSRSQAIVEPAMRIRVLADLTVAERETLIHRSAVPEPGIRAGARDICRSIKSGGDEALRDASERFGGGGRTPLVPLSELARAHALLDPDVVTHLQTAIDAVRRFHEAHLPETYECETFPGVRIDRIWSPLRRVGVYVPGGNAVYPSSLIMTVVPARAAGVTEIAVATPCALDGTINPAVAAAAHMLGITEFYAMGGAQAIAALAYGTESIRRVDKIVGPGNAWVTAAKLEVLGDCAIDIPAGPSEVLVVADDTAEAKLVAIDLLCQAEHGPDSPSVLVTTDPTLPNRVIGEIKTFLTALERRHILTEALSSHGDLLVAESLNEAFEFANDYAAEHVSVMTSNSASDAGRVRYAGSVYVGRWSPESAGDYATGANHVLPTGGLARSEGPLGVDGFGSYRQVQTLTRDGLATIRSTIETLATVEGLDAHRLAAAIRFSAEEQP